MSDGAGPSGVMFHHFTSREHPQVQGALSAEQLDGILERIGPRLLGARDFAERTARGDAPEDALCLTFDDSLRCQVDVAVPVLEGRGLSAFFFVYTSVLDGALERFELYRQFRNRCFDDMEQFHAAFFDHLRHGPWADAVLAGLRGFDPDRYLSSFSFYTAGDRRFRFLRDDVLGPERYVEAMDGLIAAQGVEPAELARGLWMDTAAVRRLHEAGHVIGLHSHTHPTRLEALSLDSQRREYETNRERLSAVTGSVPTTMSHPSGSYGPETLELLRELGVVLGFRADPVRGASLLELPRRDSTELRRDLGA